MMFENSDTLRIVAVLARILPLASDYMHVSKATTRMVDYKPVIEVWQHYDVKVASEALEDDRDQFMSALVVELDAVHTAERDTFMIGGVRVEVKH